MTYQVLARKWRPQTFAEVVGQEHITRTLQNAILQNRVGHAYLFVGPRGIGKTTSARIFAKALNCRKGVVTEPCCECESCREIASGSSLDVIEIDGASHNRVEHIRDLRENVQYTPSRSRYKIYIIDEVHMLTPAAWNALLKTLEEPPPHVKFLFATTEPHKVLPTIVSRCQRFDLKRIPVPMIVDRLKTIAEGEGIRAEETALAAIARAADGGMRDAQSIFDQMIAFCGGLSEGECIREQDVIDVFGLASGAELRQVVVGLLTNDMNAVMSIVQSLADHGRDLERLYSDIIACLRNLMLCAVCPEPEKLLEVGQSELRDLRNIAGAVEADTIQRLLQGLVTQEWSFRSALNKRVYLEAALARVMVDAHSVQLDDILAQLTAMAATGDIPRLAAPAPKTAPVIPPPPASEQAAPTVVGGKPRPAGRTQTAPPETGKKGTPAKTPAKTDAKPPVTSTEIPAPQEQPEEVAQHQVPREKTAPEPAADTTETPSDVADAPDTPAEKAAPAESTEPPQSTPPAEEPRPEPEPHAPRETEGEEQSRQTAAQDRETDADTQHADETPQEETSQSDKKAPAETTDETPAETTDAEDEDLTLETQTEAPAGDTGPKAPQTPTTPPPKAGGPEAVAAWERLLAELDEREEWRPLEPLVKQLAPVSVIDGLLQLGYPDDMPEQTVKLLREPKSQTILNLAFRAALDDDQVGITIKRWHAKLSADERAGTKQAPPEVREQVEQKEFVKKVQMLFDASIIDVRV